jgi:FKBP-type peptidyl-prolyl cis-trans isomerase FklB
MRCISLVVIALSLLAGASTAGELAVPANEKQKLSYSVGYQVGGDFRRLGLPIDAELVVRGVVDALAGLKPLMTPDEMWQTLTELKRQASAAEKELLDAQDEN